MNKSELVAAIAGQASLTKADATRALDAFQDVVQKTLSDNGEVVLVGFGTFKTRQRKERSGYNPVTGGKITIEAKSVPVFKAGTKLTASIN